MYCVEATLILMEFPPTIVLFWLASCYNMAGRPDTTCLKHFITCYICIMMGSLKISDHIHVNTLSGNTIMCLIIQAPVYCVVSTGKWCNTMILGYFPSWCSPYLRYCGCQAYGTCKNSTYCVTWRVLVPSFWELVRRKASVKF